MPTILRVNGQIARVDEIVKAGDFNYPSGATRPLDCCCLVCPPCSGSALPLSFEVQSSNWTDANCFECEDWNGNFILDLNGPGGCRCSWSIALPIKCTGLPASNTDGIFLKISDVAGSGLLDVGFAHNATVACTDGACNYHFTKLVPLPINCATISSVLTFSSSGCPGQPPQCHVPPTITLIAR